MLTPLVCNDRIEGGDNDDWMVGFAGNDLVIGGSGRDAITEGAGNDRLYADGLVTARAALAGGSDTFRVVKSRRWRHGDSTTKAANEGTWRKTV